MEIRFVPSRPWDHFPGLFAERFGSIYPREEDTGVSQIPQIVRDRDPSLAHLPYRRFVGDRFALQAGPRIVGLITKRGAYPGWDAFWPAMAEVLQGLEEMRIIRETVRLGLRYINFFDFDIYPQLTLNLCVGGQPMMLPETGLSTVLYREPFRHHLQINNSAVISGPDNKPILGSILDIDTSLAVKAPDIFHQAEAVFRDAHTAEKVLFFGLLNPDFLATLDPVYSRP